MDPLVLAFAVASHNASEQELDNQVSLSTPDLDVHTDQTPSSILVASVNVPISDNLATLVEIVPEEVIPSSGTALLSSEVSQEAAGIPIPPDVEKPASTSRGGQDMPIQHPHVHFGYQTAYKAVQQALEDHKSL